MLNENNDLTVANDRDHRIDISHTLYISKNEEQIKEISKKDRESSFIYMMRVFTLALRFITAEST
jgi:hypothetical protein